MLGMVDIYELCKSQMEEGKLELYEIWMCDARECPNVQMSNGACRFCFAVMFLSCSVQSDNKKKKTMFFFFFMFFDFLEFLINGLSDAYKKTTFFQSTIPLE